MAYFLMHARLRCFECPRLENGQITGGTLDQITGACKCYYDGPQRSLRMLLGAARAHPRLVGIPSRSAFRKRIAYCSRCPSSYAPSVSAAHFNESGRFPLMNYTGHGVENDIA